MSLPITPRSNIHRTKHLHNTRIVSPHPSLALDNLRSTQDRELVIVSRQLPSNPHDQRDLHARHTGLGVGLRAPRLLLLGGAQVVLGDVDGALAFDVDRGLLKTATAYATRYQ